jgi:hypothetical protein
MSIDLARIPGQEQRFSPTISSNRGPVLLPLLLAGVVFAQVHPGEASHALETMSVAGTSVTLRSTEGDEAVARQVRRVLPRALHMAARWGPLPASVALTVHATHAGLEAATRRTGNPWMRAWARVGAVDLQSPRTWSRGRASDEALTQILAHELTHCSLFQATGRDGRASEVPLWFLEGMASVAAGETHELARAEAIGSPRSFLRTDPGVVYGTADRAFRDLVQRFGDEGVRRLVARLGEGHAFPAAFRDALGVPLADFEGDLVGRLSALAVRD